MPKGVRDLDAFLYLPELLFFYCKPLVNPYKTRFTGGFIMSQFNDRTGEKSESKEGYSLEIIKYFNSGNVTLLVDNQHIFTGMSYWQFKTGSVVNPYHRGLCGVGFKGKGKYKSKIKYKMTPQYSAWCKMIERCYDPEKQAECPTYVGCSVCDDWHDFQVYAAWYDANIYQVQGEKMHVDKDILVKGNKIYSPETCIFVPNKLNTLLSNKSSARGKYSIGVLKQKNRYSAMVSRRLLGGKSRHYLGSFENEKTAFVAYKEAKENIIKEVVNNYEGKIPEPYYTKLRNALYSYEVSPND